MSRIVVKNLPKGTTEDKVRQIFAEKGLLTDVQLKYTSDGKFRQFAFVGYQNESDAEEAIKYFNNTCIQTNKVVVEACAALGDNLKPKSWSKYSSDSRLHKNKQLDTEIEYKEDNDTKGNKYVKKTVKNKNKDLLEKYKEDPLFEEFLEVHGTNNLKELIDTKVKNEYNKSDSGMSDAESDVVGDQEDVTTKLTDLEYMKMLMKNSDNKPRQKTEKKVREKIELHTLKLQNLPFKCKKKDIKHFFTPNVPYSIRIPRNIKGIAYVGFKNEKQFNKALLKHKSIIMGKSVQVIKYGITHKEEQETDKIDQKEAKWKTQEERLKHEEDIAESGRIFLRNLSYTTTEDDIQNLFSKFGPLAEINLPVDKVTRKLKGFGVLTFLMPEHAVKAYSELDGSILHGRMLHLLPGIAKDTAEQTFEDESSNYKKTKEKNQKAHAGLSYNWNSLFLGHNAVAEIIADTYGTSKKAVLDPHGDSSAAVRLALGETEIVVKTRKYLEQEGVVLDAFDGPTVKRSKTIILVKNLPANTEVKELCDIFKPYGIIGRVVLPPNAITALVEFIEPSEARKAFTRLAYSKFKHLPLYLEWAPENSLVAKDQSRTNQEKQQKDVKTLDVIVELNHVDTPDVDLIPDKSDQDDESPEPDTTLFVKNLNFETNEEQLKKHFESCGKVYYATIARKKDKNDPTKQLSMGYGFVRFMHKFEVDKALKTLQQSTLDSKSLELKRSERVLINDISHNRKVVKKTKQTGSKILVRNVPFQAKHKEILELFKAFGEIKALRLPKKMAAGSNSHRGFAFVDFVTTSDAKKAYEALSQSTHLYGRRLVLEWASTEEGIDHIRKRTADHFHTFDETKSKKSVFTLE